MKSFLVLAAIALAGCASGPYDEQFVTDRNPVTGKPSAWEIKPTGEQQREWDRLHPTKGKADGSAAPSGINRQE